MKRSFRDPISNVLKAWGYMAANGPGEVSQAEAENFTLTPGQWQWDGTQWMPYVKPAPTAADLEAVATSLFSLDPVQLAVTKVVAKEINALRQQAGLTPFTAPQWLAKFAKAYSGQAIP